MCVCLSVDTLTVAFLRRFSPNWTQTCKSPKVRTSLLGSISPHSFPYFSLKTSIFDPEVLNTHAKMKNAISALNVHESPKFRRLIRNWEHDGDVRFLTGSRNMAILRMHNEKYAIWPLFVAESPKFPRLKGNRGRGTRWRRQIFDWK